MKNTSIRQTNSAENIVNTYGNMLFRLCLITLGNANIKLSIENIPNGDYKLQITEIVGNKKADQPLTLYGIWECEFRRK